MDRAYDAELLLKTDALPVEERAWIRPIMDQEIDIFHLMLVTRGKFLYGLEPESLCLSTSRELGSRGKALRRCWRKQNSARWQPTA